MPVLSHSQIGPPPDEMLCSARVSTGLDEFGNDDLREAYDVLTMSLANDVALATVGRLMTRATFCVRCATVCGLLTH